MGYYKFPRYVSVAEKKARAEKKLKQLRKKETDIQPVVVDGHALARTWWGKAWNRNLERYADFVNRISRGRSYLRHGAVLDLRIEPGEVRALVQGSASRPYSVTIRIAALGKKNWKDIRGACAGRIESMSDLLQGRFPESLSEVFTARGQGLFPSPQEIKFDCSCPDWAEMCKHVAATLYGIGARLDEDPALFFILRKVKVADLISEAMAETTERLLEKAKETSGQVIAEADLADVFGIVMDEQLDFGNTTAPGIGKNSPVETKAARRTARVAVSRRRKNSSVSDRDRVLALVKNASAGIAVKALAAETGLTSVRVRNIIAWAHAQGAIVRLARGVYGAKKERAARGTATEVVLKAVQNANEGIGVPELCERTGLEAKNLRDIIFRLSKLGKIKRIRWGIYAAVR
ncbi:MAG: hypothetical protein ABIL58_11730 [Pseudomonadota bacterium]